VGHGPLSDTLNQIPNGTLVRIYPDAPGVADGRPADGLGQDVQITRCQSASLEGDHIQELPRVPFDAQHDAAVQDKELSELSVSGRPGNEVTPTDLGGNGGRLDTHDGPPSQLSRGGFSATHHFLAPV